MFGAIAVSSTAFNVDDACTFSWASPQCIGTQKTIEEITTKKSHVTVLPCIFGKTPDNTRKLHRWVSGPFEDPTQLQPDTMLSKIIADRYFQLPSRSSMPTLPKRHRFVIIWMYTHIIRISAYMTIAFMNIDIYIDMHDMLIVLYYILIYIVLYYMFDLFCYVCYVWSFTAPAASRRETHPRGKTRRAWYGLMFWTYLNQAKGTSTSFLKFICLVQKWSISTYFDMLIWFFIFQFARKTLQKKASSWWWRQWKVRLLQICLK